MSPWFEILVRIKASYGPQIDQSVSENRQRYNKLNDTIGYSRYMFHLLRKYYELTFIATLGVLQWKNFVSHSEFN